MEKEVIETNEWQSLGIVNCLRRSDKKIVQRELVYKKVFNLPVFAIKTYKDEFEAATLESSKKCTEGEEGNWWYNGYSVSFYFLAPEEIIHIKKMLSKQEEKLGI